MSKPQVLAEPVLVGREKELEELQPLPNKQLKEWGNCFWSQVKKAAAK